MTKHTPGPWVKTDQVAGDEDVSLYAITKVNRNPRWIARVYGQGRLAKKDPETAANTRLIAAAPDMLAALEALVNLASPVFTQSDEISDAYSAIAKAKGE